MSSRRGFLKFLCMSAPAASAVLLLPRKKSDFELSLETPEGRKMLAEAMCEPVLKNTEEYQAISRSLLQVDDLPQGALARYEMDVAAG